MSYFNPIVGTAPSTAHTGVGSPVCSGDVPDVIIPCSDPKVVWGIVDGLAAWMHGPFADWPRAVAYHKGLAFYSVGFKIVVVDPKTGYIWHEWTMAKKVNALWLGDLSNGLTMAVGYAQAAANTVELFQINKTNWSLTSIHLVAEVVSHPRSVHLQSGHLFISDTFASGSGGVVGRALVTKIATGYAVAYTAIYYPNDIKPMPDGRWLICAEHENRLIAWDWQTNAREMVLAAPVAPFNDITKTAAQIVAATPSTEAVAPDYAPVYTPPKQNVAQEYHPADLSLYAPNAASFLTDGRLLVASTDDDVILILEKVAGAWVESGKVTGLNNPVNVAAT